MSDSSYNRMTWGDALLETPKGMVIFGVFAILFGLFFAFIATNGNDPIPREEAVAYEGNFEKFRESKNYSTIYFTDGTTYEVYPHTLPREFRDSMETLETGTRLYLLINPNTSYAVEVRTENEELLNFETSQQEMADYQIWYVGIGGFVVLAGVFCIVYGIFFARHKKKEKAKEDKSQKKPAPKTPLRPAAEGKARILLEAQKGKYHICYRRIGRTNELVINGEVWDEYKATMEFHHRLCAVIDGNKIEAGLSNDHNSYIAFNGHWIAEKVRWI